LGEKRGTCCELKVKIKNNLWLNNQERLNTMKMSRSLLLLLLLFWVVIYTPTVKGQSTGWTLTAEVSKTPNDPYYGVTMANGMIGIVSSRDPLKVESTVLNGTYDYYGRGRTSNILQGFNFAGLLLDIDGQRISSRNIQEHKQVLHMRNALFESTFKALDKAEVTYRVRALRHLPYTSLIEVEVKALEPLRVRAASEISAPAHLRDVQQRYAVIDRPHVKIPLMTSSANSPTGRHSLAVSTSVVENGIISMERSHSHDHSDRVMVSKLVHEEWDHERHLVHTTHELAKGQTYRFSVVSSTISTEHHPDPLNEAERLSVYAMLEGRDRLLSRHEAAWDKLWERDIIVEGSVDDQIAIRSALYHLYSFVREGTAYSLSPMGLSGLGYNGHVFWDTELWMYPALLVLQPELAKSIVEYRLERLPAAREKAFAHGYKGAMFPWESNDSGTEATPVWALTGPFQHHISAVVAIGIWNYFQVTQDELWLREKGFQLLKEVADFWVSRVEENEDDSFSIINVVAADEYAENVDDNAFTNGAAITALRAAAEAAERLGLQANPEWREVADRIRILRFSDGVVQEHATYQGETIKQADVNLLTYPLGIISRPGEMRANLDYYQQRVDGRGGPAMTHSVYSVIRSMLGEPEEAYTLFQRGFRPNELPPFQVIAETAGGMNPYFATGAGGMLQAVLFGFGGVQITPDGIQFRESALPSQWKSLTLTGLGPDKLEHIIK
jgi:trehalose/maltose hydrolase-like predicted phosphorylase